MRNIFYPLILASCLAFPVMSQAQYVHIKVPLAIHDNQDRHAVLYFGVDSYATDCIDPALGEFELPSDQCDGSPICAYFTSLPSDTSQCLGNGLLLDLMAYVSPGQMNQYLVVFRTLDYPVTFSWPKNLKANYDSLKISDAVTGTAFLANMITAESLVVTNSSVQRMLITGYGPHGLLDAVEEKTSVPHTTVLAQNYPNPFNPSTSIEYTLGRRSYVTLRIYTIAGQTVSTLVDGELPPGHYRSAWRPGRLPSGVYFSHLTTSDGVFIKPMLYLR